MASPQILKDLNSEQLRAVLRTQGPILIIAGAGSGKTKTLIHKIAFMIDECITAPQKILAVTFTNKAAQELLMRLRAMLDGALNFPVVGTFHSICVRFLREDIHLIGYKKSFNIYDEYLSRKAIRQVQESLNVSSKDIHPARILNIISSFKNELKSAENFLESAQSFFDKKIADIYFAYEELLKKNNALDFDDLIGKTVELWRKHPEILEKYQDAFPYLFIDEYQDTNHAQYEWSRLLAKKHRNICVVGDDAQAIYSFRGANYRNILNFERDWPDAEVIKLEQNYRSTQQILDVGNEIISRNVNQKPKKLWTERKGSLLPKVYEAMDEAHEARLILDIIRESAVPLKNHVILYRTNAQSRALEEVLLRRGVPYRLIGGVRFYERKEVKDILAYLAWALNSDDTQSLERILNEPPRGLGDKTWSIILENARVQGDLLSAIKTLAYSGANQRHKNLQNLYNIHAQLSGAILEFSPDQAVDFLIRLTQYEEYLKNNFPEDFQDRIENIRELKTVAKKFNDMSSFLTEVSLIQDIDNWDAEEDALTLMTIHASKGLEFEHVFIAGLEEGLLPHANSLDDPAELEEERRLAYVAVTRARQQLTMIFSRNRKIFGLSRQGIPSRFLLELPSQVYEFCSRTGTDTFLE